MGAKINPARKLSLWWFVALAVRAGRCFSSAMTRRQLIVLTCAAAALGLAAAAKILPQTTPLADAHLFIAPSGQPFRSTPGQPYPVVQWFKQADADHDGKIDRQEFVDDAAGFFHVLDRTGAGVLSDADIDTYEKVMVPELSATDPGAPDTAGENKLSDAPQGAAYFSLINDAEPVRSADQSFVGRVTLKMFTSRADQNFNTLDQQGRGYLTLEDLPRTPVQRAAEVAGKR